MRAMLNNTQKAAIYQAWKDGTAVKDLAKQYGVSDQTIYNLITKLNKSASDIGLKPAQEANQPEQKPEQNAEAQKPEKIPNYIWAALDDNVSSLNLEIEEREQRIAELKEELLNFKNQRDAIEKWMEEHT